MRLEALEEHKRSGRTPTHTALQCRANRGNAPLCVYLSLAVCAKDAERIENDGRRPSLSFPPSHLHDFNTEFFLLLLESSGRKFFAPNVARSVGEMKGRIAGELAGERDFQTASNQE